ncbi:MAG: Ig-like domain-containing protein [Candidatus Saccharimonadales bacterium]
MSVMSNRVYKRVTNISFALALVLSTLAAAAGPFIISKSASALSSAVVYDALPSVVPSTNYPSYGLQAHSIKEFGDQVQLGGSNRMLNTVTVTMSNWAKYSTYASDARYSGNTESWSHPIKMNVYDTSLNLLATKEQNVSIPWRGESDPSCGTTSNGNGWKVDGTCYDFSGLAFNATFDLSNLNVTLPNEIVLGVEYDTNTRGDAPIGVTGPYDSLNITFPDYQAVSVGADSNVNDAYADADWNEGYGTFAAYEAYPGYGTVAFQVTATPVDTTAPVATITNLAGQIVSGNTVTIMGSATDETDFNYYYCYLSLPGSSEVGVRDGNCVTTWHDVSNGTLGTVDVSGLSDGNYEAHLIAYDKAGNHSDLNYSVAFKLDNTLPSTPVISTPSAEQFFKTTPITNSWSASTDANGINKYQVEYIYDDGHTFAGGPYRDVSGATTSRNHSPSLGEQGGVTIRVHSMDNAGNYSAWSNPVHYTYDATNPTVSISGVSVNQGIATINGIATDTNFNYYYCYVTNAGGEVGIRDGLCQTAWAAGTPFQSAFAPTVNGQPGGVIGSVNLAGLPTGSYTAYLVAHDKAGNIGQTAGFTFEADNTAPTVAFNPITDTSNTPTITGTVDDTTATVTLTVDGGTPVVATNNGDGTWSYTFTTPLADNTYTLEVTAEDTAGNTSTDTANLVIATTVIVPANPQTNTPATTTTTATVTPQIVAQSAVLGATTDNTSNKASDDSAVKGTTDDKTASINTDASGSIFGLAWYWWLLILAGAAGIIWAIIAAIRRRNAES